MEPDFDKEIDALLRKEASERTVTISEFRGGLHLDADEIATFAEGLVGAAARPEFVRHFADCDRCRNILRDTAVLNAEANIAAGAGVAAPVEATLPWYQRLFVFPNLAYVMGGLIVVFAGSVGLSVLTRSFLSGQSDLSKASSVAEQPLTNAPVAPPLEDRDPRVSNSMSSAANAANVVSNLQSGSVSPASSANAAGNTALVRQMPGEPTDQVPPKDTQPKVAAPAAPSAQELPLQQRRPQELRMKAEPEPDKNLSKVAAPPPAKAAATPKPADTAMDDRKRDAEISGNERKEAKKEAPRPDQRSNTLAGATAAGRSDKTSVKRVNGRTFELKQGVWYDTTYRGQGTVTVRRDTTDYQKLEYGLRRIADSFIGAVVVTIWNGQAFRIQ